ncbi:hypothetical protein CGLO_10648 [Colletotrichum gloeosporioides Cg-14]|uniref:Uncharacterized protein n=1 Tax=Colletotrichum gloeosporioides (strain Cg-14) TaxID=1237896 RepID=T0LP56_COLGC|nr:hypothetical protein CGLO_10648 [Colletotrichum gloeosporioides Cg-14]
MTDNVLVGGEFASFAGSSAFPAFPPRIPITEWVPSPPPGRVLASSQIPPPTTSRNPPEPGGTDRSHAAVQSTSRQRHANALQFPWPPPLL